MRTCFWLPVLAVVLDASGGRPGAAVTLVSCARQDDSGPRDIKETRCTVQPETHSELIPAARKIEFESCK